MKQLTELPPQYGILKPEPPPVRERSFREVQSVEAIMDSPNDSILVTYNGLANVFRPFLKCSNDPYMVAQIIRTKGHGVLRFGPFEYGFRPGSPSPYMQTAWIRYKGDGARHVQDLWDTFGQRDRRLLGPKSLSTIMTNVRNDLADVGLATPWHLWWRASGFLDSLIQNECMIPVPDDIRELVGRNERPLSLIDHRYVGYTDDPVYWYDINGAYLHHLRRIPELREVCNHLDRALRIFKESNSPARYVVKSIYQVMWGRLIGRWSSPSHRNPILGVGTAIRTREQLGEAITAGIKQGGKLLTCYVDGFSLSQPVTGLDLGESTGQWRTETQPGILLVRSGLYWSGPKVATIGFPVGILDQYSVHGHISRYGLSPMTVQSKSFSWRSLDWKPIRRTLDFGHEPSACGACKNGTGSVLQLHERYDTDLTR